MSMQWYPAYGNPDPVFDKENSFKWLPEHEPHYILRDQEGLISGGYSNLKDKKLRIDFRVKTTEIDEGKQVIIKSTQCEDWQDKRARACLMIQSTQISDWDWDRAFYSVRPQMIPVQTVGEYVNYFIEAPLSGVGWGFVWADSGVENGHLDEWKTMLDKCTQVALTFNGCSSAGHGAFVRNGKIRFTILNVAVI
jgi:kynurenine formamidase